jgi:hypothetical protein
MDYRPRTAGPKLQDKGLQDHGIYLQDQDYWSGNYRVRNYWPGE